MHPTPTITLAPSEYRVRRPRDVTRHYDRRAVMTAAHRISRERRDAAALAIFRAETLVVAGRPHHPRSLAAITKVTPANFGAALSAAWAEAKASNNRASRAVTITRSGALAMIGERLRTVDLVALLSSVASWIGSKYMTPRQSGVALPVSAPRQIQ